MACTSVIRKTLDYKRSTMLDLIWVVAMHIGFVHVPLETFQLLDTLRLTAVEVSEVFVTRSKLFQYVNKL